MVKHFLLQWERAEVAAAFISELIEVMLATNPNLKVALWGGNGVMVKRLLDHNIVVTAVSQIFDGNTLQQGKLAAGWNKPIRAPQELATAQVDCVIVASLNRYTEIISDLKSRYGFQGKILCLEGVINL